MRSDKDVEREIANKVKTRFNEFWYGKEEILENLHQIEHHNSNIRRIKFEKRKALKEISRITRKMKKELGQGALIDEELDQEFDEVNGIEYVSRIELGMTSLD